MRFMREFRLLTSAATEFRHGSKTNNLKRQRIAGNLIRGPGSQKLSYIILH